MKKLHSIKGTHDILPNEIHKWKALESIVNQTCEQFGYHDNQIVHTFDLLLIQVLSIYGFRLEEYHVSL